MKRIPATTHQSVLKRLLKQPGFRQGYEEELDKLRLVDMGELVIKIRQRAPRHAHA